MTGATAQAGPVCMLLPVDLLDERAREFLRAFKILSPQIRSASKVRSKMDRTLNHWFATQILPHEAALMRYLQRVWKSAADIPDLRQETYVRVYETAAKSIPRFPKSFLFTTARNLMIDRMRRERVVSIDYTQDLESLEMSADELSPERRLSARQ